MDNQENSDEKQLRELLKGSENSYRVPAEYFQKLPSDIMKKLENLPDFESTPTTNPFAVPEGYFDTLSLHISEKITKKEKYSVADYFRNILRPRFAIPFAFASLVIFFLITIYFQNKSFTQPEKEISLDDLKNSAYFISFDEDMLVDMIPNQVIDTADDPLEQYLIDNNIDISQIEKRL